MSSLFEEIDRCRTPLGEISLRRRWEPMLQVDVYEAKLDDEFLMSSLFTVAEVELATLGLAEVTGQDLDVAVAGLGLGYTSRAVLDDHRVRSLHVVEVLGQVIEWHQRQLLAFNTELSSDRRCHLVNGDFFALAAGSSPLVPRGPDRFHAILVDIDHSPERLLHPSHAPFYEPEGLRHLVRHLHPGGVFALWSDDPPNGAFVAVLDEIFGSAEAHVVPFANPYTDDSSANSVYVATLGEAHAR
ncbi:hypothetical protein BH23ACT2_BH23ACT2_11490 [soil metagenome]